MRVTVEAVRVLLEAVRVIIEAVRKIIETVRLSPLKQGKLWQFYIVKRGYIRDPGWRVLLRRLLHVLQATSPCGYRKWATATHLEQ